MEHYRKTEGAREKRGREANGCLSLLLFSLGSLIPPVGCLDKAVDHRTGIAGFRPVAKEGKATRC